MSLPFEGGAVAPYIDVVLLHRGNKHRSGDGAADRRGVEVGDAGSSDVEGACLQRGNAFADKRAPAVDQAGLFGAVFERSARDCIVVGFVRLAEVRRIRIGEGTLLLHPVQGSRSVEPAGEGDTDFFADGQ